MTCIKLQILNKALSKSGAKMFFCCTVTDK